MISAVKLSTQTSAAAIQPDLEVQIAEAARFVRRHTIASIYRATSGHPGGALSCADILACLFGAELNVWPTATNDRLRDRFVLSKGHACPALYAIAAYHGFCDKADALNLRKLGSPFQGHPHVRDLPWVETSTGSLGQGFSVALGMAMGMKLQKINARAYALLGDGELQEGEVWEAAMCAAHHRLDNLCAIIDYNKLQSDATNEAIMRLEPLADKWRAFGWTVFEIDGHNIPEILSTLHLAASIHERPSVLIAHTVKGKGVPYMEGSPAWHGSVKLTRDQAADALAALGAEQHEIKELLDV
ncbi:MAG: transketolase [Alphaproteobacteria bacterium]|nr:transketolase [Alphaproteobacteria bacterium]MDE2109520.1 transketolase [Alphaproteobacteria bacterium]MDE2495529.1 transketolase [Alphaproteobacteria bacterium]